MTDMSTEFSLEQFETLVASRDYEAAHETLIALINTFIANRSRLPGVDLAFADPTRPASDEAALALQRIADAILHPPKPAPALRRAFKRRRQLFGRA